LRGQGCGQIGTIRTNPQDSPLTLNLAEPFA
jgi:hypothetical protein